MVVSALAALLGAKEDWASCKKVLLTNNLIAQLLFFDRDHISDATIKKLERYVNNPDFSPEIVKQSSVACAALTSFVLAIYQYHNCLKQLRQ